MKATIRFGHGEIINVFVDFEDRPTVSGLDTGEVKFERDESPAVTISRHNLAMSDESLIRLAREQFGDAEYVIAADDRRGVTA